MKTYFISLLLLFSTQLYGQGTYPLQIGNVWQYQSSDPLNPDSWESKVLRDTTLFNGKTYVLCTGFGLGANLLRQQGTKVFAVSFIDSIEYVLFDFGASPKDTICHHMKGTRTIVLSSKYIDTVNKQTTWRFVDLVGSGPGSYAFLDWLIADSIGLTYLTMEPGVSYHMTGAKINGKLIGTITEVQSKRLQSPLSPELYQNYPNPFNPRTTFRFTLSNDEHVNLRIFDVLGRERASLIDERLKAGEHLFKWNAENFPSGIYFYELRTTRFLQTKKLLLLK